MTDDETIVLRKSVIGGKRYDDDFWRGLLIDSIMKRSGVAAQADQHRRSHH